MREQILKSPLKSNTEILFLNSKNDLCLYPSAQTTQTMFGHLSKLSNMYWDDWSYFNKQRFEKRTVSIKVY